MSKRAEEAAFKAASGTSYSERVYHNAFLDGYEQAEKDLGWHSVKESLPPVNEEVIVLTDDIHGKIVPDLHYICYGHIVDKNIAVDYDGWNIPGVTHWMYCPKLERKKQMIKKEPMKEDALDGEITYSVAYPHHEEVY